MAAEGPDGEWRAARRAAAGGGSCSRSSVSAWCPAWATAPPTPARSPPSQVRFPAARRGAAGRLGRGGALPPPPPAVPPQRPSLRRDVVRRLPVGSRLLAVLPRPGGAAGALHAAAPQVRPVHVGEPPADGHRGTHHRRHPHQYGRCRGTAAGGSGAGGARPGECGILWHAAGRRGEACLGDVTPLVPGLKELDRPTRRALGRGCQKRPLGAEPGALPGSELTGDKHRAQNQDVFAARGLWCRGSCGGSTPRTSPTSALSAGLARVSPPVYPLLVPG